MEEIDLCCRIFNQNLEVYSLYKSKVYHLGGGTLALSGKKTYLNFRNSLYLLLKNLPEKRFLRITERMIWDVFVIFLFLLKLEFKNALAILNAHFSFYRNFNKISGISFLPHSDHTYAQAPYLEINKEEYKKLLKKMPKKINWNDLTKYEKDDTTAGSKELACTAGVCEVVDIGNT